MKIETPPTVGDVIRERFIGKAGLSEAECAQRLGISPECLASTLSGEGYITAEMACVLSRQLGLSPTAWLKIQHLHDEWEDLTEAPRHPGSYLREQVLEASGLSVEALANTLGMTVDALRTILEERGPFTPEFAWRLSLALGDTPQAWMAMQARYDLIIARRNFDPNTVSAIVFPEEDYTEDAV